MKPIEETEDVSCYKSCVDKAYSMAWAGVLLDRGAAAMLTQPAGRLSYDAQTGYIVLHTDRGMDAG